MIEVITRKEGQKSEKIKISLGRLQTSYNSDGHLVIRVIHSQEEDTLIVLDEATSIQVIRFIKNMIRVPDLGFKDIRELPF